MPVLRIAELFASIQGEGTWIGVPSTFIRVSGCNLRCGWCDTPYASWYPEGPNLQVEEILEAALKLGPRHAVLTGGEPMLFEPVETLALGLKRYGFKVTVETAGTVFRDIPCDLMSISPKLSNSIPDDPIWKSRHDSLRIQMPVLTKLVERYDHQLKFVFSSVKDLVEIEEILAGLPLIEPERILLMPEGRDHETLLRRSRELVPICLDKGWRLAPRLHIDLFGDTKGT